MPAGAKGLFYLRFRTLSSSRSLKTRAPPAPRACSTSDFDTKPYLFYNIGASAGAKGLFYLRFRAGIPREGQGNARPRRRQGLVLPPISVITIPAGWVNLGGRRRQGLVLPPISDLDGVGLRRHELTPAPRACSTSDFSRDADKALSTPTDRAPLAARLVPISAVMPIRR